MIAKTRLALLAGALSAAALLLSASPAAARFHQYSHSFYGSGTNALQSPHAIAVDNSAGPSSGDVYVSDNATFRVEKFDSTGNFILMFGKEVNKTAVEASGTEAEQDVCTAASGDECQVGAPTGVFASLAFVTVDGSNGPSAGDIYLADYEAGAVYKFKSSGHLDTTWRTAGHLNSGDRIYGIVVGPSGDLFVHTASDPRSVERFAQDGTIFEAIPDIHTNFGETGFAVDTSGNFYFEKSGLVFKYPQNGILNQTKDATGFTIDQHSNAPYAVQAGRSVQQFILPCNPSPVPLFGGRVFCSVSENFGSGRLSGASGIAVDSDTGNAYVADTDHHRVAIFAGIPSTAPIATTPTVSDVHTESATLHAQIGSTGEETSYRFEYGTTDCSALPDPCSSTTDTDIGNPKYVSVDAHIEDLSPGTVYHYRIVATNPIGTTTVDRTFTTYPAAAGGEGCPNALARQQTEAASLLDCRAYELVSAADADGNSVASDLIPGQEPLPGYPRANSRALYTTASGGIPNSGKPTNFGGDPYLATRSTNGWSTKYVGIPADVNQETGPFASTLGEADSSLGAFAFAGAKLCSPCLEGKTGLPVRNAKGALVQGMAGSLDPGPSANAGILVRKRLSSNGTHLIFGSTSQFEPDATPGTPTIYDRDLTTNTTKVVSKLPGGANIPCVSDCAGTDGVAELDLSADGSRVLIGQLISTDASGNRYWHLYMNVGDSAQTIDLTPGATDGALFGGMSADGTKVYFTTKDVMSGGDSDESADIYRADVSGSAATLTPVTTTNFDSCDPAANSAHIHWNSVGTTPNCDAVAIAGGGGVASGSGDIYLLSPELLDGPSNGTQDAPNLYLAKPGSTPRYVSTLESSLNGPQPTPTHHPFLNSFGGSFAKATATAVDSSNGDVYVLDAGTNVVRKFDSEGNPVTSFGDTEPAPNGVLSGLKTPAGALSPSLFGGFFLSTSIAVDHSNGDLYVPDLGNSAVDIFDSSGTYLRQISISLPSAVALDPTDGDIYAISDSFFGGNQIKAFDSTGNPLPFFPTIASPTGVAVDDAGTIYVANKSEAASYELSSGHFLAQIDPNPSRGLAVDPANQDIYVDEGGQISQFDSSGNPVGTPSGSGHLSGALGLAANSGHLFAANGTSVAAFGPPALDPSPAIDNPAVIDSLNGSEAPDSAAFEVSPSGNDALFTSTLPLTGYENSGFAEIFRYDAPTESLDCVSCDPANASGTGTAALASDGSSLTEDGRVFFTTPQQLVLRDVNGKKDAYEWEDGKMQLISTGSSAFDSGLLSVSGDGTDAYFFTRDSLVAEDENGSQMKLYDARAGGGIFVIPPRPSCAASDECHGAGTEAPPAPPIKTHSVTPGNVPAATKCKPGFVKRHGKCVKKPHRKKHHSSKHHKRANHNPGGAK